MKKKPSLKTNYDEYLIESLKDPRHAVEYVRASLEHRDMPELLLLALRHVAEARGMTAFSADTKLNREHLYRILSKKGNPGLLTLHKILDALGLKLSVELKEEPPKNSA